jgi:hypothetical protein
MHLTPAGLPSGMPGIGLEIDGAMQHAPQPGRHSMREESFTRRRSGSWRRRDYRRSRLAGLKSRFKLSALPETLRQGLSVA